MNPIPNLVSYWSFSGDCHPHFLYELLATSGSAHDGAEKRSFITLSQSESSQLLQT